MEILVFEFCDESNFDVSHMLGEADSVVEKRSGGKQYNVKLTMSFTGGENELEETEKKKSEKVKFKVSY